MSGDCSFAYNAASGRHAFTLVEMLVVMVLIGIVAGVAMLSISGGGSRRLEEEAERLKQALQLAADEAVFQGTEIGVAVSADHYDFLRYDATARRWGPFGGQGLRLHRLPDDLHLSLMLERSPVTLGEKSPKPALIFLSTGEMTPFALTLISENEHSSKRLGTDGIAPIALQEGEAHE